MSFDLYFCWRKEKRINFEDVKSWSLKFDTFTRNDAQLWYKNPKTGVYFSLDFESQAPESAEDSPSMPDGYFDSGLSFNLNYNRPSYFGLEALPFVEQVAARFGLCVVDRQADGDEPELITVVKSETLVRSWVRHNQRAILALIQDPEFQRPLRMPSAASLYLWRYGKAKDDLERTCVEGIFVPALTPVQRKGEARVGRVIAYTPGLPMIVPECEWVFVVGTRKRFFRPKENQTVTAISFQTFRERLSGHIKPFQWPDPLVQIIDSESSGKAGKIIESIDRTLPRSEFEVIGTDSFVDVEVPGGD